MQDDDVDEDLAQDLAARARSARPWLYLTARWKRTETRGLAWRICRIVRRRTDIRQIAL